MPTDNVVYVQERDGWWWVWRDSMVGNDGERYPDWQDPLFETARLARACAMGWSYGDPTVECGRVIILDPQCETIKRELVDNLLLVSNDIKMLGLTKGRIKKMRKLLQRLEEC